MGEPAAGPARRVGATQEAQPGPALVLNASMEPLAVVSARRAVVLVLASKAEVVHEDGAWFRSERLALRAPTVVRLTRYVHVPRRVATGLSRRAVFVRDGGRCQYCGAPAEDVDHVVPRSRGGEHRWENVVAAGAPLQRDEAGPHPVGGRLPAAAAAEGPTAGVLARGPGGAARRGVGALPHPLPRAALDRGPRWRLIPAGPTPAGGVVAAPVAPVRSGRPPPSTPLHVRASGCRWSGRCGGVRLLNRSEDPVLGPPPRSPHARRPTADPALTTRAREVARCDR